MGKVDVGQSTAEKFWGRVRIAVKELLENKHLYQSVAIPHQDFLYLNSSSSGDVQALERRIIERLVSGRWDLADPSGSAHSESWFRFPDVKLYCAKCERLEAFNLISSEDFLSRGKAAANHGTDSIGVQVFITSFLCQSCKLIPEVFILRRQGARLTLCGRAPMEHPEVPELIPKKIRSFYTGAVLAYQSGQLLPGNFMLRTLIEQWARISTGNGSIAQADQLLDMYMESLPGDFKARFPSLRALYGDLSIDIHRAQGSPELFERAKVIIVEHFDARRLFRLPDTSLANPVPEKEDQASDPETGTLSA
ncbi:MAG: hypothetical protein ABIS20_04850 [Thermoanaerobaculia bacterium]